MLKKLVHHGVAIFRLLVCFVGSGTTLANAEMGQLEVTPSNGITHSALLLDTAVRGNVNGLVATVTVEQSFSNDSADWVHGRYLFPLPEMAAVSDMEIHIGERVIRGEVQEKQAAKQTFEMAKKNGKKAGLVEQHRANLFSVNLSNIGPGEKISTRITYVDRVFLRDDTFELRLPTTITPRYITGQPKNLSINKLKPSNPILDVSLGWASATDQVADANLITPPQAHQLSPATTHHFSLDLIINPGIATNGVKSKSHQISTQFGSGNQISIALKSANEPLDRDLILNWQARDTAEIQAAFFQQTVTRDDISDYYNMLMVMPPQLAIQSLPRDVTFVIDTSGSMSGTSINQAKQALLKALAHISVNDRFNIIEFNSRYSSLFKQSQFATSDHLYAAKRWVRSLDSGGGTEMIGPLRFAMQKRHASERLHQIIFLTDGSVGNEAELFQMINQQLGNARLFTIAIGSAPNNYFMRKAAKFGRGFYLQIANSNDVAEKIEQLSRRIQQPVMQNIKIKWPEDVEQFPQNITDLYAAEPLVIIAKSKQALTELTVEGELNQQKWQQRLSIGKPATTSSDERLDTVWARAKVEHLMDSLLTHPNQTEEIQNMVTKLGVQHTIATQFTSFVAIEQQLTRPDSATAKHHNVPNLMPHGSTMQAPQTATPATLLQLLGSLLLLLTVIWQQITPSRWPSEIA